MAKKTKGSFFTKLLIISAILLGLLLTYSYVIGNSIQPHLGVVEKIYVGIFSSAETISGENKEFKNAYNLESNIKITQENKKIFEGNLNIDNAQIFSNPYGLEQRISTDVITLSVENNGETEEKILENLDIISQNENIYIGSKKGLQDISKYIGKYIDFPIINTVEKISKINQKGSYAHINNAEAFHEIAPELDSQHLVHQLFTTFVTSNPRQYFKKNNLTNLVKQNLYNDKWIEYLFIENKKISENNKQFFILNKNICEQIHPFFEKVSQNSNEENIENNRCEDVIQDITPFIALVSQIYKFGDIENGNYDFVISQGTNIDIRFTYANHILQTWNIFIQNPENTLKTSFVGDKFGLNESQITLNYNTEEQKIIGNIVNGSGDIFIDMNTQEKKIKGNIILQNYLLVDMDVKGSGKISGRDMKLTAVGDYKNAKIEYLEKQEEALFKGFTLWYAENNYKIDYISPKININGLYAIGKFIGGFSEKSDEGVVIKEIKYVYDQGTIKGHYRIPEFEGNIEGEILSQNTFQVKVGMNQKEDEINIILEGKEKSDSEIQYSAEGTMNEELLFTLKSFHENKNNISNVTADIDIPKEKIKITFIGKLENILGDIEYDIPKKVQKLDINMNEIIVLPNIHQVKKIIGPEFVFAGVTLGSIGATTSYLKFQGETREILNQNILSDIDKIAKSVNEKLQDEEFDIVTLIQEAQKIDSSNTIRIGGDKISFGEKYQVGTMNYDLLGLEKDLLTKTDYKIALLFHGEKVQYQILGFLEQAGSQLKVVTKGNYIPREFIRYDFEVVIPEGEDILEEALTLQIKIPKEHDLKIGDMTNLGRILDMVDDKIFIENDIHPDISKIYLLGNDAPTLFIENNKILENGQIITKK